MFALKNAQMQGAQGMTRRRSSATPHKESRWATPQMGVFQREHSCRYIIASFPLLSRQRGQSSPASAQISPASHSPASPNGDFTSDSLNASLQILHAFIVLPLSAFSPFFTTDMGKIAK